MKDFTSDNSIPESLDVQIEKLVYGGDGLARTEYGVVLVAQTVPGDFVNLSAIQKRGGVLRGRVRNIRQPSKQRVSPFCNNFLKGCGGCQWQHIDYREQVRIKRRIVEESIERIGKKTVDVPPLICDLHVRQTRLRSVFRVSHNRLEVGFYRINTHEIVPIKECPLCLSPINHALSIVGSNVDLLAVVDSVSVITNGKDAHIHLACRRREIKEHVRNIYGLFNQVRGMSFGLSCSTGRGKPFHFGPQYIEFSTAGLKYLANGNIFFQGHRTLNEKLVQIIKDLIEDKGDNLLLDLFCGMGFLSIPVASRFNRVIGIDSHGESIHIARKNAMLNGFPHLEFFQKNLGLKDSSLGINSADVVILDPPRKGCPKRLIGELISLSPSQIIMVSCNPTTMARDLRILMNNGYGITSCHVLDLFPQTFHVETIVDLKRM